jgi:hypothetical protein
MDDEITKYNCVEHKIIDDPLTFIYLSLYYMGTPIDFEYYYKSLKEDSDENKNR